MKRKKKKNNGIVYVAISLIAIVAVVVGVTQIGKAQVAKSDLVELTEFANSIDGNVDAFKVGLAYLGVKIGLGQEVETLLGGTIGSDVFHDVVFHGDTQIEHPTPPITIPIVLRPTTTDAGTPLAGVAGKYKNIDDPMLCYAPSVYFWDANGVFSWSFGVGTTTEQDGLYLANTTSRTLWGLNKKQTSTEDFGWNVFGGINTTTSTYLTPGSYYSGYITADFGYGYNSSTPWLLDTNDVVVIDIVYDGATSTDTFLTGNTDTTPGAVYLDCFNIY